MPNAKSWTKSADGEFGTALLGRALQPVVERESLQRPGSVTPPRVWGARSIGEQDAHVYGVEPAEPIAAFARHIDLSLVEDDFIDLSASPREKHPLDAIPRGAAAKGDGFRCEQTDLLLVEQPLTKTLSGQMQ